MSTFVERVIGSWLTDSDERGYQLSFASFLTRKSHTVKYVSSHGALEFGKDVVSVSPTAEVCGYQLKAGNIGLNQFRGFSEEVRDCARVPVQIPGLPERLPDRAYLVTTGRLSDPVRLQIHAINAQHQRLGYPIIETIELDELVKGFIEAFESFFPHTVAGFYDMVRLYLLDGRGPQEKPRLCQQFEALLEGRGSARQAARALADLVIVAEFCSAPFRRATNYISMIDTWVVAAVSVLNFARTSRARRERCQQALDFCRQAIDAAADGLYREVTGREDLIEGDPLIDSTLIPYRRTVCLGYMAAFLDSKRIRGVDTRSDAAEMLSTLEAHIRLGPWGEGAWNLYFNLALALQMTPPGVWAADEIVSQWLRYVCPPKGRTPRDPYWTMEEHASISEQRRRSLEESDEPLRVSYTALAAVHYLARRPLRKKLAEVWRDLSRTDLAEFVPEQEADLMKWHNEAGTMALRNLPLQGSWSSLKKEATAQRTSVFSDDEAWLMPFYLCTYNHRVNPSLAGELDRRVAWPALLQEWESLAT